MEGMQGVNPFSLAYDMEAIISTKIGMPIVRTIIQEKRNNSTHLEMHLDQADKDRKAITIQIASYHQRAIAQYNKKARPQLLCPGDLVLRRVFENNTDIGVEKLKANWMGPYVVIKVGKLGAYHLQIMDGRPLLCPWNIANFKKYYQ